MEGNKQKLVATLGVIALVVIAAVVAMSGGSSEAPTNDSAQTSTTSQATEPAETTQSETAPATAASYKDGDYAATGTYQSPGGEESIELNVSIKDGVVTNTAAATSDEDENSTSGFYQKQFVSNYKAQVVGKSIDEIKLNKVAGSSLTSQGFNEALAAIKQQAKA